MLTMMMVVVESEKRVVVVEEAGFDVVVVVVAAVLVTAVMAHRCGAVTTTALGHAGHGCCGQSIASPPRSGQTQTQ